TVSSAVTLTPTARPSDRRRSPSAWNLASDRITSPGGMYWSSSATKVKGSSVVVRPSWVSLMYVGIHGLLERGDAGTPECVEEPLAVLAFAQIDLDQLLDGLGDLLVRQGGAQDGAQRRVFGARAAQGDLVELLALLIDAKDADVAD